ncbi:MAG: serine/threonine protein kinase [Gemmatimonadetes bacterium]|nr:serine/threonine protein kinase [Gemmatimonadota bacterium]
MTLVHVPVTDLAPGQRVLDRFVIMGELGRGGYSVVYSARDLKVDADVALKFLVPPPAAAREAKERLRREVQLVRGLRHPRIVGVHEFIDDGPLAFVVMDLIDGTDLARRVTERGPLPAEEAIRLAQEIASALVTAHRAGILHRDIKPANIILDHAGRAFLADFGSARLDSQATMTRTGGLVGTVAYLAPEVWLGQRPDARTDLYALGVTLFEALTGRLPARPSSHLPPTPEPDGFRPCRFRPELPPWLDQIVAMTTMADPRHRFATAEQLLDAVEQRRFPSQPMVAAALSTVQPEAPRPRLPRPVWVLLGGIVITGALAGVAASLHFFWATPVVALLVWRNARRDLVAAELPKDPVSLKWELIGPSAVAYQRLPQGTARNLLEDVLVLARAQVESAAGKSLAARWRTQLEPLVATAVEVAGDLAEVDETLARMEGTAGGIRHVPVSYWESMADLERTRDGLSTMLLELIGALGRARGAAVEDFDSARFRLEELVGDLKGDLGRSVAAARDIEAALRKA